MSLFPKQVGMGACSLERDHFTLQPIDQQPIWLEMALAMPFPLSSERMVPVLLCRGLPMDQTTHHDASQIHVIPALLAACQILLEARCARR